MMIDIAHFGVSEGDDVDLGKRPTRVEPLYGSDEEYETLLRAQVDRLSDRQELLYAADSHALLVIFQGMDTSGKDGAIRHVMSGVNPQGCEVVSFKEPSSEDLQHDFLWRAVRALPKRGRIGIFNRSYYEEVVVVRVHPELLAAEGAAIASRSHGKKFWRGRYRAIVDLERHLDHSGTRIVKVFLHLSREEQRQRLLARIDEPEKNWKFGKNDVSERAFWKDYMKAYEHCLSATSREEAPWFVVPADDKRNARLIVSEVIVSALEGIDLRYPEVSEARRQALEEFRRELEKPS